MRLYTQGREGEAFPWCAGLLDVLPLAGLEALDMRDAVPADARVRRHGAAAGGRLLSQPPPSQRVAHHAGQLLPQASRARRPFKYGHTGIVVQADGDTFKSIEGNTNDDGSFEGYEVCARVHGYPNIDFIVM